MQEGIRMIRITYSGIEIKGAVRSGSARWRDWLQASGDGFGSQKPPYHDID